MALYKVVDEFMKLDIFSEQGSNALALYVDSLPLDLQKKIRDSIIARNKTNIFQFIVPQITPIASNYVVGGFNIQDRLFVLVQEDKEGTDLPRLWHAGDTIKQLPLIEDLPEAVIKKFPDILNIQQLFLTGWYVKDTLVTLLFDNFKLVKEYDVEGVEPGEERVIKNAVIIQYNAQAASIKEVTKIPLDGAEENVFLCGSDKYIKSVPNETNTGFDLTAFTIDKHVMIDSKKMDISSDFHAFSLNDHTFVLMNERSAAYWYIWDMQAKNMITYRNRLGRVKQSVRLNDKTVAICMMDRNGYSVLHLDLTKAPYDNDIEKNKFTFEQSKRINLVGSFGPSTVVLYIDTQLCILELASGSKYTPIVVSEAEIDRAFPLDLYTLVGLRYASLKKRDYPFLLQWPEYNLFSIIILSHIATAMQTKRFLSLEELIKAYELINTMKSSLAEYDPLESEAEKAHKQKKAEIRRQSLHEYNIRKFLRDSLLRLVNSYYMQERTLSLEEINQLRKLCLEIYPSSASAREKEKHERDLILEFIDTHARRLEAEVTNQAMSQ